MELDGLACPRDVAVVFYLNISKNIHALYLFGSPRLPTCCVTLFRKLEVLKYAFFKYEIESCHTSTNSSKRTNHNLTCGSCRYLIAVTVHQWDA